MKGENMGKRVKSRAVGILAGTIVASGAIMSPTMAWGPERTTYTMANPATSATFNSITDNAAVGDERNFVRIVEKGINGNYGDTVEVQPGKQYEVYIYYHNDASATFNDAAHNYVGVARDVRLSSGFTETVTPSERGKVSATISASNTTPAAVWDEAYMTATEKVTMSYVEGSAKIYNDWGVNGSVLSTNLFSNTGVFLGLDELNGVILGCDEYSGQVVYTLAAYGEDTPVTPTPVTPTPGEIPETGPAEIILAAVIVAAIVGGGIYWYKTRKKVKTVTKRITNGKKPAKKNVKRKK